MGLGSRSPGLLLICARRLDRPLGWLPASHLSLVVAYTRSRDDWREYAGSPTRTVPGAYGPVVVNRRPYRPRPDRPHVTVALREYEDLTAIADEMDRILDELNAAQVVYEPFVGPNSNAVVRAFLIGLGLPPLQPAAVAPGFEHEGLIITA